MSGFASATRAPLCSARAANMIFSIGKCQIVLTLTLQNSCSPRYPIAILAADISADMKLSTLVDLLIQWYTSGSTDSVMTGYPY